MIGLWIFLAIVAILVFWVVGMYNRLVQLRNRIENAWSQIDVQLKRRVDLIPNLVETVKGYARHEKETFERVIQARSALVNASGSGDVKATAQADNMLTGALKSLFALAEAYPELKANQNFMMLQEELTGTESKIAYARQFYNDTVLQYDNGLEMFPTNILAGMFGFQPKPYFETPAGEREPVKVQF
jgi:LemA protein